MASNSNRLPQATSGGASAEPTPANNAGGGSGWGDSGHPKGGVSSDVLTAPEFRDISDQKSAAEHKFLGRFDEGQGMQEGTCATEDHSFMERKPGGSGALPGWETMKDKLGFLYPE
ncbi:uncharacterized protein BO95DRAFT_399518 [Aspergillus brunneoviolaceus CBS 621.78]|uniref:Uncharacterized protein n=1 Tax=Aspergillus brunneoviolaceus CBS 621.78 TaxID=1450534 RepID=A0ACD1FV06_9EURO|nr:hypothetical protein BO95DRAFT_399518 [Aspergillus brunneoviolaceus CBS 621.78]RAH40826.1 hypothetical protein BO95DRAFT_399518 [Aspergillus brunneoviolaceus CBS 621.78]